VRQGYGLAGVGLMLLGLAVGVLAAPWSPEAPVTVDTAAELVRDQLTHWGYEDLAPKEVMEFTNHFYVLVVEKSTGKGAVELLVERNGFVRPEPGPNMMWNTKYGHMGGPLGAPPVSQDRARELAQEFLARTYPGTTADEGTEFYGYFTFDVPRGGRPVGMLSVNAYTGQVWYHGWHGAFVREKEL
jgi:hypothetical protein